MNYLRKAQFKFKMKFLIIFVFLLPILCFVTSVPNYLRECKINLEFQVTCINFNFNENNCFPWDTQLCQIDSMEEHVMCYVYDCAVRMSIVLLSLFQRQKICKYFKIDCFIYACFVSQKIVIFYRTSELKWNKI
jgi:hypothetical protein